MQKEVLNNFLNKHVKGTIEYKDFGLKSEFDGVLYQTGFGCFIVINGSKELEDTHFSYFTKIEVVND